MLYFRDMTRLASPLERRCESSLRAISRRSRRSCLVGRLAIVQSTHSPICWQPYGALYERLPISRVDGILIDKMNSRGRLVTRKLHVPKPARQVLDDYRAAAGGRANGPPFRSKTGRRLVVQNVDDALKKIAAQANASLPSGQQIHLSAHMLRHTCLRKATEKDIRYAMKLSGHFSSQYIWRYIEPSAKEFDAKFTWHSRRRRREFVQVADVGGTLPENCEPIQRLI